MAPPPKFTDQQLRQYMAMDFTPEEIARYFHVTRQAVEQRIAKLEKPAALSQPKVVQEALASVFDTRAALEENFKGCYALLKDPDVDALQVRSLVLKHIEAGLKVVERLYQVSEQQAFQEEVLRVLDECEPGTRQRILERLSQRRAVRAAFASGPDAIPA